jgi:hypothetical protein
MRDLYTPPPVRSVVLVGKPGGRGCALVATVNKAHALVGKLSAHTPGEGGLHGTTRCCQAAACC